jgi:mannose-6-phosphate isomerase-like protein (cupin superfamily)
MPPRPLAAKDEGQSCGSRRRGGRLPNTNLPAFVHRAVQVNCHEKTVTLENSRIDGPPRARQSAPPEISFVMAAEPMIIRPCESTSSGEVIKGLSLVIGVYPAAGLASEVAPLHVHHEDDEAWHVISGALRFRFVDRELIAEAGSTVLVPAGVAHTFGNAGSDLSRFIIILPTRLHDLITHLHAGNRSDHKGIYQRYASELLE